MHRATAELVASGAASRAKKAGDIAPDFSLKDPKSKAVSSADLLKRGFYRGVWCPYCNMELQALEAAKPEFDKYDTSLVAISPQTAVAAKRKDPTSFWKSLRDNPSSVDSAAT